MTVKKDLGARKTNIRKKIKISKKISAKKKTTKKTTKQKIKKKIAKKAVKKKTSTTKAQSNKPKAPIRQRANFRLNEYIVYPSHGVGQIVEISEMQIADQNLEFFVINFKQERMVLRVPVRKISDTGMRKLANERIIHAALVILKQQAKLKRTMWSRRAQEYEMKINSGDLLLLCEVVRDLHRAEHQPDQSYSERQLYEKAFFRLMSEFAAIRKLNNQNATELLFATLNHPSRFPLVQ